MKGFELSDKELDGLAEEFREQSLQALKAGKRKAQEAWEQAARMLHEKRMAAFDAAAAERRAVRNARAEKTGKHEVARV